MTHLSVNINKIATIRNARGGNVPDVTKAALDCERFGAQGITVHPRPDERHIRYSDVRDIRPRLKTEFNMEGNPIESFIALAFEVHPDQVTLVPDAHDAITSNAGWDTVRHQAYLKEICARFKAEGIRTSIFIDPDPAMAEGAARCGCDRVELYTENFARKYAVGEGEEGVAPYAATAKKALECGLAVNAGHDLSLDNLAFFLDHVPGIAEVSIGHALISEALYLGLEETIRRYRLIVDKAR
ncbi:MAG: pyridoxine 5'-phosphate synthase [Bacteroidales bacterium]|nr:pyridoxine 5'-phosphate synthase [Bacteroidales bacterium]